MTRKTKNDGPTFVDVFAGCGGLSLGLKRAGWRGLFAIEKDAFAFETLSSNLLHRPGLKYQWPAQIEIKPWSITELLRKKKVDLRAMQGNVDLLAGGPPCQGFSHAGRRNVDDPRNQLFKDYLALVDILQPKFVLVENVRGFKASFKVKKKGQIGNFAETLEDRLSKNYEVTTAILRANEYGVPQSRPRFILLGVRKDIAANVRVEEFFPKLAGNRVRFLKDRGVPLQPASRDVLSDLEIKGNGIGPSMECPGFDEILYKGPRTSYQRYLRDSSVGAPTDTRLARHRDDIKARFSEIIRICNEDGRLATSLSAEVKARFGLKKMAIRVLDPLKHAPTVTSLPDDLLHYSEPRTLTVRENARLQTFPDWFAFKGKYTSGGHLRRSEVPRFTQVANAVPPLLAEQLGLALIQIAGASASSR